MPSAPLISIVTPSYNQGGTIEATIRSVLDQRYCPFEHWVIDGGSTDSSVAVLERYPHLHWVSEPDRGQTHAINKGLARGQGEIFAYLNSDDVYRPGCFEQVVQAFADPSCQVLVGDCDRIDAAGELLGTDRAQLERPDLLARFWRWGEGVLIPQPAVFIRRSLLDEAGAFDESYDMAMDLEMWLRLARRAPFTLLHRTLAGFRVTPETKSSTRQADMVEESRRAALAHQEIVPAAERTAFLRELERQSAGHLLTVAEQRRERGPAARALQLHPIGLFSRRMLKALLLPALMVALGLPAAAWGPTGHRAIGKIAENHLPLRPAGAGRDSEGRKPRGGLDLGRRDSLGSCLGPHRAAALRDHRGRSDLRGGPAESGRRRHPSHWALHGGPRRRDLVGGGQGQRRALLDAFRRRHPSAVARRSRRGSGRQRREPAVVRPGVESAPGVGLRDDRPAPAQLLRTGGLSGSALVPASARLAALGTARLGDGELQRAAGRLRPARESRARIRLPRAPPAARATAPEAGRRAAGGAV
ncbi:MAG: glycosyltransferase [Acidobacteria bacterium]|nr:glycosyltransferase [Acidobacteriota bacterium]